MKAQIAYYGPNDELETISGFEVVAVKIQPGAVQGYGGRVFLFCPNDVTIDNATGTFAMAERILDKMMTDPIVYLYVRALNNYKITTHKEEYHAGSGVR
jgi:hypothetical protein